MITMKNTIAWIFGLVLIGWFIPLQADNKPKTTDKPISLPHHLYVQGIPASTEERAMEFALEEAQIQIQRFLQRSYQIEQIPSISYVRQKLVKDRIPKAGQFEDEESRTKEEMTQIDLQIEITADDIRYFRKLDRINVALWDFAYFAAALFVIALGFRIEEWTRGYLTRVLLLCAIGILIGLVATWFLAR